MARKLYPTDLSERQWQILKPLIPAPLASGRPRTVDIREIVNAIFYILASGCAWRLLPHDLPAWATVYLLLFSAVAQRRSLAANQPGSAGKGALTRVGESQLRVQRLSIASRLKLLK